MCGLNYNKQMGRKNLKVKLCTKALTRPILVNNTFLFFPTPKISVKFLSILAFHHFKIHYRYLRKTKILMNKLCRRDLKKDLHFVIIVCTADLMIIKADRYFTQQLSYFTKINTGKYDQLIRCS